MEEQIEIKVCVCFLCFLHDVDYTINHILCLLTALHHPLSVQRLRTENRLLKQRIETLEKVRYGLGFQPVYMLK